jgi:hypothetical protein
LPVDEQGCDLSGEIARSVTEPGPCPDVVQTQHGKGHRMDQDNKAPAEAEQNKNKTPAEQPVDEKAQEDAATERKETGGYQ